jgi:hypothetical protein
MKNEIRKRDWKKFQIDPFHLISGIFLLPFLVFLFIEIISRIAQGDLFHYNRQVYGVLSQTLFYWLPVQFTWAFLFPLLVILLNIFTITKQAKKDHERILSSKFIKDNIVSFLLLLVGLVFLAIIAPHFIPFVLHGINSGGIN